MSSVFHTVLTTGLCAQWAGYTIKLAELKDDIAQHHQSTINQPGHATSQLLRFSRHIGVGDIIVIPSNSNQVAICHVTGNIYENVNANGENGQCPFYKRCNN